MAARIGAEPRIGVVRAGQAVDRRAMGWLCAALSQRDAPSRGATPRGAAGGAVEAGEFFGRLLLREPLAMSSFAAGRAAARAGGEDPWTLELISTPISSASAMPVRAR